VTAPARPLVVLVPHREGPELLGDVPGVEAVPYEPKAPLPAAAETAPVLIPPMAPTDSAALMRAMPRLELVQLLSAGAEAWTGKVPRGVQLSDCRGAHGAATADWVLAALLATWRSIPNFVRDQLQGRWSPSPVDDLDGKRVLILGAGDIASHVARRLAAFEVATTMVGRTPRPGVHGVDEVHRLLPAHHACVVVVPLTDATRGLVDTGFLSAMPRGAVLVNAGRGAVVDTGALLAELGSGRLRAALDVTDPEPLPPEHPLWRAPGLLLTPHIGSNTPGALVRAYRVAAEQIALFGAGRAPANLVHNGY
jgi:phosphoglycerate dehydrogenase-like enzyme